VEKAPEVHLGRRPQLHSQVKAEEDPVMLGDDPDMWPFFEAIALEKVRWNYQGIPATNIHLRLRRIQ
jgi:hypothetical protein